LQTSEYNNSWHRDSWNALTANLFQLPHALLLYGPRGIGKLALARRFANLVLCEARVGSQPCGRCDACRWFKDDNHPDFRLIQPEALAMEEPPEEGAEEEPASSRKAKPSTEIKVDQVRALGDFLYIGSHRGARRVALVHPAEAMNVSAANALLKALEEPPANAMFVLVSHEPSRLPPTVRSRCVKLALAVPRAADASAWLKAEGVGEPERWLAYAGGAPMLALDYAKGDKSADRARILDAMVSGTGSSLAINDRESLELLAEVMQKRVYDMAFQRLAGRAKYGSPPDRSAVDGRALLAFARELGRSRALARRPLNPRLFASEILMRYGELTDT